MNEAELWAREVLAELRDAHFVPLAWIRFLARSFARARERRRERASEHRLTLGLGAAGLAAWLGVGLAGFPGLALAGAGWWLLVVLMLDWHLGMLERPDGRPLRGLGLANTISVLRAGLVPALPALSPVALAVALLVAGTSDVLDGRIARGRDEVTRLGLWLDGSVDGVVLGVGAVSAVRDGLLPAWIAALAVARYSLPWLVVGGAFFLRAEAPARDGFVSGRAPGVVLLASLALAILGLPGGGALVVAGALGGMATFGATIVRSVRAA